jgi:hypothetical protein
MSDEFTEAWGSVQALRVAAAMSYVKPDREDRDRLALAAEIDRLKEICQTAHARLLRGDSDADLLELLETSWQGAGSADLSN